MVYIWAFYASVKDGTSFPEGDSGNRHTCTLALELLSSCECSLSFQRIKNNFDSHNANTIH